MQHDWLGGYLDYYSGAYGADPTQVNPYQTSYGTGNFGDYFTGTGSYDTSTSFQNLLGAYGYQGLGGDITQALGNVFDLGSQEYLPLVGGFGTGGWGTSEEDVLALQSGTAGGIPDVWFGETAEGAHVDLIDLVTEEGNPLSSMQNLLGFTDIFDPESIANTLQALSGIGYDDPIRAAEVKALTPEMLEKTKSAYYSPYEESEREGLVEKLGTAVGKVSTGGFAGSGGRQAGLSGAERLYKGGYGDLLSNIMKMRGESTGNVLDTIYGWQELASGQ